MSSEVVLYDVLKKIFSCIDSGDRQLLNQFDLTVPRYCALKHIHENPGISLTDLSALMLNDKSNTTRLIRNIQEGGLVVRRRSESDRRVFCLYLSESGEQRFQRASEIHEMYIRERFSAVDIEIDALVNDLLILNRKLESDLNKKD